MSIDATSTMSEVEAQYDDNAGYREKRCVASAQLFAEAIRIILRRYKSSAGRAGESVAHDMGVLQDELGKVETWYSRNARSRERTTYVALRDSRA